MTGENKTEGTSGKLLFVSPDARRDEKSLERSVESNGLFFLSVTQIDLQSARSSNDELPTFLMGVCSTILTRRHIIDVENTLYREWHLHILVYIGKASAWVFLLWKLYNLAIG